MTTTHLLSITADSVDLCIVDGTSDSDRADAIVAAAAFTDGDNGDEILRPGMYPFHVDDDGHAFVGSPLCTCGHPRSTHQTGTCETSTPCPCEAFAGWDTL